MSLNIGMFTSDINETGDERYTPDYAVNYIAEFAKKFHNIWCPFDTEDSAYTRILRQKGHKVFATGDEDFFYIAPPSCDCIITNPPFSKKNEVLKRLYKLHIPFAILLPIPALQATSRFDMFHNYGLQLLVPDRRIDFWYDKKHTIAKGRSPFGSAYFCYKFLPQDLMFKKIEGYEILKNKEG